MKDTLHTHEEKLLKILALVNTIHKLKDSRNSINDIALRQQIDSIIQLNEEAHGCIESLIEEHALENQWWGRIPSSFFTRGKENDGSKN